MSKIKNKKLTVPNKDEGVQQLVGGNVKSVQPLWKTADSFLHTYRIILTNYQRIENLSSHKNLYSNVHSSFIQDSSKLVTAQMSIDWWVDTQIVLYPYIQNYSIKRKRTTGTHCMDKSLKHCAKWKKPDTKHCTV